MIGQVGEQTPRFPFGVATAIVDKDGSHGKPRFPVPYALQKIQPGWNGASIPGVNVAMLPVLHTSIPAGAGIFCGPGK
jgi:hypothetical protein